MSAAHEIQIDDKPAIDNFQSGFGNMLLRLPIEAGRLQKPRDFDRFVIRSVGFAMGVADAGAGRVFDVEERLKELSAKGDDLERLNTVVSFELFRAELERAVQRSDRSKGGRPAFDHVLMFKVLILQASHSLSDERTEYLIKDRLSFMRFLGLGLADTVPDANTIWTFRGR